MYVPAPFAVSLCPVNANNMKHEVKNGSKTCPPPPPPPPPSNEMDFLKISDNMMKHKIVLASFVEVHWVTTTIRKVSVKLCRSNCIGQKVCQSKSFLTFITLMLIDVNNGGDGSCRDEDVSHIR